MFRGAEAEHMGAAGTAANCGVTPGADFIRNTGPYLRVTRSDNLSAGLGGPMEVTGSCGSPCWHCSLRSRLMAMS